VVDWFALGIWNADGQLVRALSVTTDHGVVEDVGTRLPFERRRPVWRDRRPAHRSSIVDAANTGYE
jgi:hypothetical protein